MDSDQWDAFMDDEGEEVEFGDGDGDVTVKREGLTEEEEEDQLMDDGGDEEESLMPAQSQYPRTARMHGKEFQAYFED